MTPTPLALVADDEPSLRSLLATFLGHEYAVVAVADGEQAYRALLADPAPAVAVLDCDMPGLSGPDALARARAAGCRVPVLLVSGSSDPPDALSGDPRAAFLAKPFTRTQLLGAVSALVAPTG